MSILEYDGCPYLRKFQRETLKIGGELLRPEEPRWMGDIEEVVSHFLCPEVKALFPRQRHDVILEGKRNKRMQVAEHWIVGLSDGTYSTRAVIARANKIRRARVTRLLNEFGQVNVA